MNKIKTLVIDDEPLARERIRNLLYNEREIELTAEAENGLDALDMIRQVKPDLVFLDIQMPGLNGFDVLANLDRGKKPEIIFVTAYDTFAIKAFEVNAIDYILKPFDKERFDDALEKAKTRIRLNQSSQMNEKIQSLLQQMNKYGQKRYRERFVVKNVGRISFIEINDVDWLEADGNYIKLHMGKKSELIRDTIKNVEKELDPEIFIRVHRSALIRISAIKEIVNWFNNGNKIILLSGDELVVGPKYRANLNKLLR